MNVIAENQRIQVGTLGRAHGVRGELRFFPLNPDSDLLEAGFRVFVRRGTEDIAFEISAFRRAAKFDLIRLTGVDDRDQAEALTNLEVFIAPEDLPEPAEGEFYLRDLIGLDALILLEADGDDAREIGVVDSVFETGANDVIVVILHDKQRLLVPLVEVAVAEVDVDSHVLLWPLDQWAPEDTELPPAH